MDTVDRDAEFEERLLDLQVKQAAKLKLVAAPVGRCLNCGARCRKKGQRWCDDDCRDDWQKRQMRGV